MKRLSEADQLAREARHAGAMARMLAWKLQKPNPLLKTGVVQQFGGTTALVAVEGAILTLQVADSVSLSTGLVVICAVEGRSGYVIGTVGTTIRTASGFYEGGYGNPLPPDGLGLETYVLEVMPSAQHYFRGGPGSGTDAQWQTAPLTETYIYSLEVPGDGVTGGRHFWYYTLPQAVIDAAVILKVEVLMSWDSIFDTTYNATAALSTHNITAKANGTVYVAGDKVVTDTVSQGETDVVNSWVEVSTALITGLKDGSRKGLVFHWTAGDAKSSPPAWYPSIGMGGSYGKLRITYQA